MDQAERRRAKAQLVANMAQGQSWRKAAVGAGLAISRSAAYRLAQRVRTEGAGALEDQRHGHPSKLSDPIRQWLVATCREAPCQSGRMLQAALKAQFGLRISIGHLNALRAQWNLRRPAGGAGKKSAQHPVCAHLAGGCGKSALAGSGARDRRDPRAGAGSSC